MLRVIQSAALGKASAGVEPGIYVINVNTGKVTRYLASRISQQSFIPMAYTTPDMITYHETRRDDDAT